MDKAEKKALQERYNDISQMAFEAFATYYLCDGILEEMLEDRSPVPSPSHLEWEAANTLWARCV